MCLLKTPRHLQLLFAALTRLDERLFLETSLTLKVEISRFAYWVHLDQQYAKQKRSWFVLVNVSNK
jgi:hypothetical protein